VNRLYFGENLKWLRDGREFPDASVDLGYLDPPFIPESAVEALVEKAIPRNAK
jgi:hypothetical protein